MEKREPSYPVAGNINWCNHYGEQYAGSLKIKNRVPHDPAIPLLGIYLGKTKTLLEKIQASNVHSSIITKTWKQLKCPSTDEWIKMCDTC